jgi:serine/threonine protein kinase
LQLQNRFRRLRAQMSAPMAGFIGAQVAEALDYAHRRVGSDGLPLGIIHRDVSPQNVLFAYDGTVKVIDFGIAKAASRATKTQAGVLKGKFGYMSPEQVAGMTLDHRSDIFAIGTILYELLTADRLFVAESDYATLEKVRNVAVPRPRAVVPSCPVAPATRRATAPKARGLAADAARRACRPPQRFRRVARVPATHSPAAVRARRSRRAGC